MFDTLIALFLALSESSISLSQFEKDRLYEVGEQLELDPDDWEFISAGLMAVITSNQTLNQVFKLVLAKLSAMPSTRKQELLPTENEIAQIFYSERTIERRGYFEGEENLVSKEILNVAPKLLQADDPAAKIKNLNWIDRINKLLPSNSRSN
ncbi:MAG: hypothetical protein ACRCU2_12410 [Planktothrix sp.]